MKGLTTAFAVISACAATGALAGGLDRSGQGIDVIFEPGTVLMTSMSYAAPNLTGTGGPFDPGNIADSYMSMGVGFKYALNDKIDLGVIIDQPFGAAVSYKGSWPVPVAANLSTMAATVVGRYHINENISVHAGIRAQTVTGTGQIGPYSLDVKSDVGFGYLVGAAYEKPEIALRAALTYNSGIDHTMTGTEMGAPSTFAQSFPRSVNFDFQTGIAKDTLLMASVRWAEWGGFTISPPTYGAIFLDDLVSLDHNIMTYEVGIGHRFTDKLSGAFQVGYERTFGDVVSDLSPSDGFWSVGLGGSYQINDNVKLSAGLKYVAMGDAVSTPSTGSMAFTNNHAFGGGLSLTTSF